MIYKSRMANVKEVMKQRPKKLNISWKYILFTIAMWIVFISIVVYMAFCALRDVFALVG